MQVIVMYLATYTHIIACTHVTIINEKEALILKEGKKGYMGKFGGRKEKEEMIIIIL